MNINLELVPLTFIGSGKTWYKLKITLLVKGRRITYTKYLPFKNTSKFTILNNKYC